MQRDFDVFAVERHWIRRGGVLDLPAIVAAEAGRATYINAMQLEGHVDPGAEAVARLFAHLAN